MTRPSAATKRGVTSGRPRIALASEPTTRPRETADTRILSAAHLAQGPLGELSEFEFGLMVAHNAFSRWAMRCMAAAGMPDLAITDILVLHHVQHRDRSKKLSDICFTLNYEDTHVVSYALKKLVSLGLLSSGKQGKEVFYAMTPAGRDLVQRYREIRRLCLLPAVSGDIDDARHLADVAELLRAMSGLYDQAARAAASL